MANTAAKEKFLAFKKQYEEARKLMVAQTGAALKEMVSEIFEDYPDLESFGWRQYTPYFNDGDICEFSVNNDHYSILLNGQNDDSEDEGWDCSKCGRNYDSDTLFCPKDATAKPTEEKPKLSDAEATVASKLISAMLQNFDDAMMLDLYGDHVTVTIHRDGSATKEEYEHD
jgi:hypothetical protein